ncbi:MAG: hypothetical protein HZY79_05805 [Rhodoblastus sp.]|nr:MAG: hypothetical protein HZY79_05805 [Rhodoblastus sp.]
MSPHDTREIARPNGLVRLGPHEMKVEDGARAQTFRYADVEALRLSFRPRSLAFKVFRLDLRMSDGRTLRLHNVATTPGAVFKPYQRWDEGYATLARALTARVAAAAPQAQRAAGFAPLRWNAAALAGGGALAFVSLRAAQALAAGYGQAAVIALAGAGLMGAFLVPFLARNRPRPLAPDAIPSEVLP